MKHTSRAVTLAVLAALGPAVQAACPADGATPFTAGPVDPVNGFATYVQDSEGLALELCLTGDGAGICFFDPPIANNAFSQEIGFGPEAFWWLADNVFATPAIGWTVVMAAEAAWAAEIPGPGEQFPFTRLRIRIDTTDPGIYTLTHPYGTIVYDLPTSGTRVVNDNFDIPFTPDATNQGRVGPWLKSVGAPFSDPAAPNVLFIGDGTPRAATGSPCGNNFVRMTATEPDGVTPLEIDPGDADRDGSTSSVSNDSFVIFGQVYAGDVPTPLVGDAATFSLDATDAGFLNVFATAPTDATVTAGGVAALTDGQGRFFASRPLTGAPPATVAVTATAKTADPTRANNLPTTVNVPVIDLVSIARAEATCTGGPGNPTCSLTVEAGSSDASAAPGLEVTGFGLMTGGILTVPGLAVVPATVTVTSAAGGSDSEPVRIINQ